LFVRLAGDALQPGGGEKAWLTEESVGWATMGDGKLEMGEAGMRAACGVSHSPSSSFAQFEGRVWMDAPLLRIRLIFPGGPAQSFQSSLDKSATEWKL